MRKIFIAAILMLLTQNVVTADAASMSVVPGANGIYYLKGFNFTDIGGVEVEILYDGATLSNPRVTQGPLLASSMFIPNPNCSPPACSRPNSVKIAAMSLSAISGSGDLAIITFDLKGGAPGPVAIGRSKLVDSAAKSVKQEVAPPVTAADTSTSGGTPSGGTGGTDSGGSGSPATGSTGTASTGSGFTGTVSGGISGLVVSGAGGSSAGSDTSGSSSAAAGTITLPQDQVAAAEAARKSDYQPLITDLRKDVSGSSGDSSGEKSSGKEQKNESLKKEQPKFISHKSTLQLFKEFAGERSATSLISLFAEISVPDFTQEPAIAYSDGITPLKITLTLKQSSSETPKFLLEGANVKQLGGEGEGTVTWTIEAVPKKDAVQALLTVLDGQNVIEFPLTVVPMINPQLVKGKGLSEADFTAYLAKPQKFDFNVDKKFDAVDDYIYTANYIVAMKIKPEKARKDEKKEGAPKAEGKGTGSSKVQTEVKEEKKKSPEKPSVKQ